MERSYSKNVFITALMFLTSIMYVQSFQTVQSNLQQIHVDLDVCKYYPAEESVLISTARSEFVKTKMDRNLTPCSTFIVTYNGFTQEAQDAFQFAVDIWANQIESPIDIRINATFAPLATNVLGSAGSNGFIGLPEGAPTAFFPRALAEAMLERETPDTFNGIALSTDINANFTNADDTFSFSLNLNDTPGDRINFVTVVLHELGHGLGILGFGRVNDNDNPSEGLINNGGLPAIWDTFIENGAGTSITDFPDPSGALLFEFTSGKLFSNGPVATFQNGGVNPSTHAPATFNPGSSYSHWDETLYPPGNFNSLMTPILARGEVMHNPGVVTLGFMEDMGWTLCNNILSTSDVALEGVSISPNPFIETLTINLPSTLRNDNFNISIVDINGSVVIDREVTNINGEIILPNLSSLKASLYFITVESLDSGVSFTNKIIKR